MEMEGVLLDEDASATVEDVAKMVARINRMGRKAINLT